MDELARALRGETDSLAERSRRLAELLVIGDGELSVHVRAALLVRLQAVGAEVDELIDGLEGLVLPEPAPAA